MGHGGHTLARVEEALAGMPLHAAVTGPWRVAAEQAGRGAPEIVQLPESKTNAFRTGHTSYQLSQTSP